MISSRFTSRFNWLPRFVFYSGLNHLFSFNETWKWKLRTFGRRLESISLCLFEKISKIPILKQFTALLVNKLIYQRGTWWKPKLSSEKAKPSFDRAEIRALPSGRVSLNYRNNWRPSSFTTRNFVLVITRTWSPIHWLNGKSTRQWKIGYVAYTRIWMYTRTSHCC